MRPLTVTLLALLFAIIIGGIIIGLFQTMEALPLLVGVCVSSVILWAAASLIIGRKPNKYYTIYGLFSPLVGLPMSFWISGFFTNEEGYTIFEAFSVYLTMPFILLFVVVFLGPLGLFMGVLAGLIMQPDKHGLQISKP